LSILHSCRDCEQWPDCPYADADQCPKLREELRGVDRPRHVREETIGYLDEFSNVAAQRTLMPRLIDAREAGPERVKELAVRVLRQEGFSLREIEDLCQSGWSHMKAKRSTG